MSLWIATFLLIPLADQAIKALLRQRLGDHVVSLGPLGSVRVIDAPVWWARGGLRPTPVMLWIAWLAGAGALLALSTRRTNPNAMAVVFKAPITVHRSPM
jgi:hypothetical protein